MIRLVSGLLVLLVVAALLSLLAGRVWLSPGDILSGDAMASLIVLDIRLPRTLGACLAGALLGLAGLGARRRR